jgi:hypothetical protein
MIRLSILAAGLGLAACGGGGSGEATTPAPTGTNPPGSSTTSTTPGVWKGTINSTTDQSAAVVALTGHDGHSVWMTTDGRVFHGTLPLHGDHFDAAFIGHMYEGEHFPDGTNHGTTSMMVDHHSTGTTGGRYSGSGDAGSFNMARSPMWDRAASLSTVAGVYTRSTSNGYTMTMTLGTNGQMMGSDSKGCVFSGTVSVPDPQHNLYHLDAQVSACGSLDGHYQGTGTLLDADAMQDWMTAMHPLEHGGHSHGGSMMGGHHDRGHNTVPSGQHNLFMFSAVNDHNAIMDALWR